MLFSFTWEFKGFSLILVVICQKSCLLQGGHLTDWAEQRQKKIPNKKQNPQNVGNINLPLPFQKLPFQEFHFSIHKRFSFGTFKENLIRYQFLTKCFYKFRKGEIPSQSIWNGREPQGYSILQQEGCGELLLDANLLSHGRHLAVSWSGAAWLQHCRGLRSRAWFPSVREREG